MLILKSRFAFLEALDVSWPDSYTDVLPALQSATVVNVRCAPSIVDDLRHYAFRIREAPTVVVDLRSTEEELWRRLHRTSTRQVIQQAAKFDFKIGINQRIDEAIDLIEAAAARAAFRKPLSRRQWKDFLPHCDVFTVSTQDELLAADIVLIDPTRRARPIGSGTASRHDSDIAKLVGVGNRYLRWKQLLYYQEQGVTLYDFGGIELDRKSPLYTISQFKLSFGGTIVEEFVLRLTRFSIVRFGLRVATTARVRSRGRTKYHHAGTSASRDS